MSVTAKSTRTTLTLDPDVVVLLERDVNQRGVPFKVAVNDAIRAGLTNGPKVDFSWPTYDMGEFKMDITKANQIAADLEDEAIMQKLAEGR